MAVFEANARRKPGTRSNTKLLVSGGMSPAEHWITDPNLPILFNYDYGGPGQKEVVISKGMAVGIKPDPVLDYESGKKKGVLTIASDANPLVGLAPYNFAKHNNDFLDGNQPSIITREYIELPYIPNATDAADVSWGAVHGNIKNGDYVTFSRDTNNSGKLVKWESGVHSVESILGQVLAMELDQEPWGWLKWALWDETAKREDEGPNKSGYAAPGAEGYPYDANYREGTIEKDGYQSIYTTNPTGIPGILDGSQKAQTQQSTGSFALVKGMVSNKDLGLKNIVDGTVVFTLDDNTVLTEVASLAAVVDGTYFIDYKNGQVYYQLAAGALQTNGTVQFRAHFFGTPAGWDFKGAVGAVRILLKR